MTQRAFIFDMDGTIVDNMSFHTQSWVAFFQRRGLDIDADAFFRATAGRLRGFGPARICITRSKSAISSR